MMPSAQLNNQSKIVPLSKNGRLSYFNKLAVSGVSKIEFIDKDKIIFCKAKSNYTTIQLESGREVIVSKCLKYVSSQLENYCFFRCHASFIINLNYLESIHTSTSKFLIAMGYTIPISKTKFSELKLLLGVS